MAPRNAAFWFLCQVLNDVRKNLPAELYVFAAGKSDLCNQRWDRNYEEWKGTGSALGRALASESSNDAHKTFVFWLDEVMQDHHLHQCWSHALDGACLWDQLTSGCNNYMSNIFWCMMVAVAAWLRHVCRIGRSRVLQVVCVCNAGKHRSVFFSRMLQYMLSIVFKLLRLDAVPAVHWMWAAEERVRAELDFVHRTRDPNNAKARYRQAGMVVARVKRYFLSDMMPAHVISFNLNDKMFSNFAQNPFQVYDTYRVDTFKFLNLAKTTGNNPGIRMWIGDLLVSDSILSSLIPFISLTQHWNPVVADLMSLLPDRCSLCQKFLLQQPYGCIYEALVKAEDGGAMFLTADEVATMKGSGRSAPSSSQSQTGVRGVSLLTAAHTGGEGSGGKPGVGDVSHGQTGVRSVSLLTAASTGGHASSSKPAAGAVPKRLAWADAVDDEPQGSSKKQRKVRFAAGSAEGAEPSPNELVYFVVAEMDLENQVLLCHGGIEVDISQDAEYLVTAQSRRRNFAIQASNDAQSLVSFTEELVRAGDALRQEMNLLEKSMVESGAYPPCFFTGWCGLRRFQFYIFLHMWSILTRQYTFFVSSPFLLLATLPLQVEKGLDVLLLVHRYCYVIWLHRTESAELWNQAAFKVLLPSTDAWQAWWAEQQDLAQDIVEMAFSDEYACMTSDPLTDEDGNFQKQELSAIKRRMKHSDLALGPELPDPSFWVEHDAYIGAREGLATPRALPVFRCSAGGLPDVSWGSETGEPKMVTRSNIIIETDCCLETSVPVPRDMMLSHIVGTRDWLASFQEANLGHPYWIRAAAYGSPACASDAPADCPDAGCIQIHLQALGAELMATIRPDNVMHPHLRSHVEFSLGVSAAVHLARGDAESVRLTHFLLGCGIKVQATTGSAPSWVHESYSKRHDERKSVLRPVCHTLWGEKTRPIGFRLSPPEDYMEYFLVHDACPLPECENMFQMLGFGTICNHWHGFSKKHANMCTLAAQRWLNYSRIGERGKSTKEKKGSGQYFRILLEELEMVAPEGTIAGDADDRILIVGLPRWLPAFHSNNTDVAQPLVPYSILSDKKHFLEKEVDACMRLQTRAAQLQASMASLGDP